MCEKCTVKFTLNKRAMEDMLEVTSNHIELCGQNAMVLEEQPLNPVMFTDEIGNEQPPITIVKLAKN